MLEIVPVETRRQWRDFHRVPNLVFAQDPAWVAPLLLERQIHVSRKHNPYFQHAEAEFWLALRDGEPVGRISAQIDRLHLETHRDSTGHFGFLDAVDDPAVFSALLRTAEDWLRARGLTRAVGPLSFSLWHEAGVLIEGFDTPPYVMMGHALPYFSQHIAASGYHPAEDLIAYSYGPESPMPPAGIRIVERAIRKGDIRLRPLDKSRFDAEVATILEIVNDAWSANWGFVPMTEAEVKDFARTLRMLLRPGDISIAEHRGRAVAFCMVFPNLNEAIRDMGGRLAPFGWAKLLWRLKIRHPHSARMPLMGVRREFHDTPLGAALALATIQSTRNFNFQHGVTASELSWILASNTRVQHVIGLFGAKPYKRYRIYEKPLTSS